jgi:ABC-type transport system involved in multi-copper enzyme maturation permease subunit
MSATAGVLPPALAKEVRALLPTYAAALGSIAIGCVSSSYLPIALGLLGFAFGSVALGAQSFGLEYNYRTLGLLLTQPIDRRRVYF